MGIIDGLVDAAKLAFERTDKAKQMNQERKTAAADYYQKISDTLKDTVDKLRQNENPYGGCEKMLRYAEQLPASIGDVIGLETAKDLSKKLTESHEIDRLLIELQNENDPEEKLAQLEKAVGYFEASADSLRASPGR